MRGQRIATGILTFVIALFIWPFSVLWHAIMAATFPFRMPFETAED